MSQSPEGMLRPALAVSCGTRPQVEEVRASEACWKCTHGRARHVDGRTTCPSGPMQPSPELFSPRTGCQQLRMQQRKLHHSHLPIRLHHDDASGSHEQPSWTTAPDERQTVPPVARSSGMFDWHGSLMGCHHGCGVGECSPEPPPLTLLVVLTNQGCWKASAVRMILDC